MYHINNEGHLLTGTILPPPDDNCILWIKLLICKVGTENQYQFHGVIVDVKVLIAIPSTEKMFNKWKQLWEDILPEY